MNKSHFIWGSEQSVWCIWNDRCEPKKLKRMNHHRQQCTVQYSTRYSTVHVGVQSRVYQVLVPYSELLAARLGHSHHRIRCFRVSARVSLCLCLQSRTWTLVYPTLWHPQPQKCYVCRNNTVLFGPIDYLTNVSVIICFSLAISNSAGAIPPINTLRYHHWSYLGARRYIIFQRQK
jgi:hypothetical protein